MKTQNMQISVTENIFFYFTSKTPKRNQFNFSNQFSKPQFKIPHQTKNKNWKTIAIINFKYSNQKTLINLFIIHWNEIWLLCNQTLKSWWIQ